MATGTPAKARDLTKQLARDGWEFAGYTHGGHLIFVHPIGGRTITSATPSDWRATRQALAQARRQVRHAMNAKVVK
jgi:predicted RNA binding protein YcfA (HicA-like mRNA interferase family)